MLCTCWHTFTSLLGFGNNKSFHGTERSVEGVISHSNEVSILQVWPCFVEFIWLLEEVLVIVETVCLC